MHALEHIHAAVAYLAAYIEQPINCCIVLGSGLGSLADSITQGKTIPYANIPYFPTTSVPGHRGELIIGYLGQAYVVVMRGRAHTYEGYDSDQVSFPMRVMKALGIDSVIHTNACGGMREDHYLGALVLIEDHINFSFDNPLIGQHLPHMGQRFVDLTYVYDSKWRVHAFEVGSKVGIRLHSGIYGGITGPAYLSKSELKMLRRLGADVVGMSTIPEVIVARQMGFKILAISVITDLVVPESLEPLEHEMVVRVAQQTRPKFTKFITCLLNEETSNENV